MDNKRLKKLLDNEKFLFLVPNLIIGYQLLYYYNNNFSDDGTFTVLFSEVIFLFLALFILNSIIYIFLKKSLKNTQKIFFLLSFWSIFYFVRLKLLPLLIFFIGFLIIVILFKKFIHCKLEKGIIFFSFIIIFLFSYNFAIGIYHLSYNILKNKNYDKEIDIKVDNNKDTPNIYWIHCDGMMSIETVSKYFFYHRDELENYFLKNKYYLNKNASLVSGHATQKALVSLFNPDYYDNFFKEYVNELEKNYITPSNNPDFLVNYYDLVDKRLNNELFMALEKKGYSTIAIADFDPHASFYTDYYYDFYTFALPGGIPFSDKKELRYMDNKNNSKLSLYSYIQFNHFRNLLNTTYLYPLFDKVNYLSYETLNYKNFDISAYPKIDNSTYWLAKVALKGIDHSLSINTPKFVFLDYKLNHLPITYDGFGNEVAVENRYNLNFYSGNYIYASKLLTEILDFIHKNDKDAIIVVQGDHGIHMMEDEEIMRLYSFNIEQLQEIRNSVINAVYIPEQYQNGDEKYLSNPLNISRYLVNSYVGNNYKYVE